MNTKETGAAVRQSMKEEKMDQAAFGRAVGLTQSSISRIISGGRRPEVDTLQKITHCWRTTARGLAVMVGHLRDECTRAGWPSGAVRIEAAGDVTPSTLRDLSEIARVCPDLAEQIHKLITASAASIRAREIVGPDLARAAESTPARAAYRVKKTGRNNTKQK